MKPDCSLNNGAHACATAKKDVTMTKTLLLQLQIVWHIATSMHGMTCIAGEANIISNWQVHEVNIMSRKGKCTNSATIIHNIYCSNNVSSR